MLAASRDIRVTGGIFILDFMILGRRENSMGMLLIFLSEAQIEGTECLKLGRSVKPFIHDIRFPAAI